MGRLINRGLVQICGVTPSDASHVLGLSDAWNPEAAVMALDLFGRQRTGAGVRFCRSPEDMARKIVDRLTDQTSTALLECAFAEESREFDAPPAELARHLLTRKGLDRHSGILRLDVGLGLPVIGLGASAPTYYPAVGDRLGCPMVLPEHADVANAIGAVVGRVTVRRSASITKPSDGLYRAHVNAEPKDFTRSEDALKWVETHLDAVARKDAKDAGAEDAELTLRRDIRTAVVEGSEVFVEAEVVAEASGRPRIVS